MSWLLLVIGDGTYIRQGRWYWLVICADLHGWYVTVTDSHVFYTRHFPHTHTHTPHTFPHAHTFPTHRHPHTHTPHLLPPPLGVVGWLSFTGLPATLLPFCTCCLILIFLFLRALLTILSVPCIVRHSDRPVVPPSARTFALLLPLPHHTVIPPATTHTPTPPASEENPATWKEEENEREKGRMERHGWRKWNNKYVSYICNVWKKMNLKERKERKEEEGKWEEKTQRERQKKAPQTMPVIYEMKEGRKITSNTLSQPQRKEEGKEERKEERKKEEGRRRKNSNNLSSGMKMKGRKEKRRKYSLSQEEERMEGRKGKGMETRRRCQKRKKRRINISGRRRRRKKVKCENRHEEDNSVCPVEKAGGQSKNKEKNWAKRICLRHLLLSSPEKKAKARRRDGDKNRQNQQQ